MKNQPNNILRILAERVRDRAKRFNPNLEAALLMPTEN